MRARYYQPHGIISRASLPNSPNIIYQVKFYQNLIFISDDEHLVIETGAPEGELRLIGVWEKLLFVPPQII